MRPFTVVEMTLSQQLWSLSTYSHLITALWKQHKLSFLTGALYADAQAIVKNIYFTTAELQLESPLYEYYILFEGTDCIEGVFSNVRTQDHAPNFDILQLAHKLSIATEINAIFERHPDLNCGQIRRNLSNVCGVDHTNPNSWVGNVTVGNVKIEQEYKAGRDDENELLKEYIGSEAQIDFDKMFNRKENPTIDHLRPGGNYIGCCLIDETENDDDMRTTALPAKDADIEDLREELDTDEHNDTDYAAEELNPSEETNNLHYLLIDGKKKSKLDLVAQMLCGFNSSRKVTSRPLQAQGFSKDEQLCRSRNQINSTPQAKNQEGKIKIGDPGAILVHVGKIVCLAVVEVVTF